MRGGDFAAIDSSEYDRQTIGAENRQHHARHRCHRSIGNRLVQAKRQSALDIRWPRRGGRCVHTQHVHTVHLPQPERRARQRQCVDQ